MIFTAAALLQVLFAGLVLFIVYFIAGKFIQGTVLQIIGIIILVIFLLFALQSFAIII